MEIQKNRFFCKKEQVLFALLAIFYSFIMFVLFYKQCLGYRGLYLSDMEAYILEARGLDSGYSFPYPVMFWTARAFSPMMHVVM